MTSFAIIRKINVSSEKVWNLLSDFEKPLVPSSTVTVERKGTSGAGDVGTIRMITLGKKQIREKLESINPPNQLTYSLLSGIPVKNYNGTVDINPINGKTCISWKVKFNPTVFGSGWIIKRLIKKGLNRLISEIEKEYKEC